MSVNREVILTEKAHVRFVLIETNIETLGGRNLLNLLQRLSSKNTRNLETKQRVFQVIPKGRCVKVTFTTRRSNESDD